MKQFILKKKFTCHHNLFMYYACVAKKAHAKMIKQANECTKLAIELGAIAPDEATLF